MYNDNLASVQSDTVALIKAWVCLLISCLIMVNLINGVGKQQCASFETIEVSFMIS